MSTPRPLATALAALALALAVTGCKKPCKEGKIDAAWEAAPLDKLMLKEGVVCEGSSEDELVVWKPARVHDANMEAVGNAQDNGWTRNDDNWYPKAGAPPTKDYDSPKWSKLSGPKGALRIDVKEEGGGALVTFKLSERGAGAGEEGDAKGPIARAAGADGPAPSRGTAPATAEDTTVYRVPVGDSPQKGAPDALVTLVVFSDFQCPFCKRLNPTFEELLKAYPGKLRVVWKHRPLSFHARAQPASKLAIEAGKQKGVETFWKAHDLLFANMAALQDADLERYAGELGLDAAKAKAAFTGNEHAGIIAADVALAESLKVNGTPQVFVNGRRMTGAQPVERFRALIDAQLPLAEALVAKGTPAKDVYEALQKDATAP